MIKPIQTKEQIIYDQTFLDMHNTIKVLLKQYLKPSTFLISYLSEDDSAKNRFLQLLLQNTHDGYIMNKENTDEFTALIDMITSHADRYGKRKLDFKKIKNNINPSIDYFTKIIEGRIDNTCVFYLTYDESFFNKLYALLSPPEIISGVIMNDVSRKTKTNDNLVAIIFVGTKGSNGIYIQSNLELKTKIYDALTLYGNPYIEGYKKGFFLARGLLWGVPPIPNSEQAQLIIDNLKR